MEVHGLPTMSAGLCANQSLKRWSTHTTLPVLLSQKRTMFRLVGSAYGGTRFGAQSHDQEFRRCRAWDL
jgi:hypothetical protein